MLFRSDELNDDDEPPFDPETLQPLVNTIEELTGQTKIKFAALRGGSTYDYFLVRIENHMRSRIHNVTRKHKFHC